MYKSANLLKPVSNKSMACSAQAMRNGFNLSTFWARQKKENVDIMKHILYVTLSNSQQPHHILMEDESRIKLKQESDDR